MLLHLRIVTPHPSLIARFSLEGEVNLKILRFNVALPNISDTRAHDLGTDGHFARALPSITYHFSPWLPAAIDRNDVAKRSQGWRWRRGGFLRTDSSPTPHETPHETDHELRLPVAAIQINRSLSLAACAVVCVCVLLRVPTFQRSNDSATTLLGTSWLWHTPLAAAQDTKIPGAPRGHNATPSC